MGLRHQTGAAYSTALQTKASAEVRRAEAWAPHVEPARRRNRQFATEAFHVLPEGELAIKRDSMVCWILGAADGGTVDGDRKLRAGFPIIQDEGSARNLGRA